MHILLISARFAQVVSVITVTVMGYILDLEASKTHALYRDEVVWVQDSADRILIVAGIGILVGEGIARWLKPKSREQQLIDRMVQDALDRFWSRVFDGIPESEPRDNNRVTLFEHRSWQWKIRPRRCAFWPWGLWNGPASGWLCVAHRSGHTTKASTTVFLAPDESQHAEGICGRVWRADKAVRVRNLPDLSGLTYYSWWMRFWFTLSAKLRPGKSVDREFEQASTLVKDYASSTYTAEAAVWYRLRKKKRCPTAILGIPIETADNARWGVLIMDSSNGIECIDTNHRTFREAIRELKRTLSACGVVR